MPQTRRRRSTRRMRRTTRMRRGQRGGFLEHVPGTKRHREKQLQKKMIAEEFYSKLKLRGNSIEDYKELLSEIDNALESKDIEYQCAAKVALTALYKQIKFIYQNLDDNEDIKKLLLNIRRISDDIGYNLPEGLTSENDEHHGIKRHTAHGINFTRYHNNERAIKITKEIYDGTYYNNLFQRGIKKCLN